MGIIQETKCSFLTCRTTKLNKPGRGKSFTRNVWVTYLCGLTIIKSKKVEFLYMYICKKSLWINHKKSEKVEFSILYKGQSAIWFAYKRFSPLTWCLTEYISGF